MISSLFWKLGTDWLEKTSSPFNGLYFIVESFLIREWDKRHPKLGLDFFFHSVLIYLCLLLARKAEKHDVMIGMRFHRMRKTRTVKCRNDLTAREVDGRWAEDTVIVSVINVELFVVKLMWWIQGQFVAVWDEIQFHLEIFGVSFFTIRNYCTQTLVHIPHGFLRIAVA